jgi:hypothetical protein
VFGGNLLSIIVVCVPFLTDAVFIATTYAKTFFSASNQVFDSGMTLREIK